MEILWVDLETTGIEDDAVVLEVAALLTNAAGDVRAEFQRVFQLPAAVQMLPKVQKMHTDNGLLADCSHSLYQTFTQVDEELAKLTPRQAYLGGSSVGFDRKYIERDLPLTSAQLHYRNIDSSTLKNTAEHAGVLLEYPTAVAHRALDDILVSLSIYRQVRRLLQGD